MIWFILTPFIAALAAFIAPRSAPYAALGAAAALLSLAVGVSAPQTLQIGGWGVPLGISLRLDALSQQMLLITALVGLGVTAYAAGYFKMSPFWPLWMMAWGGLNALFLAADIFNIYVCLEVVSFSAIALVAVEGSVSALNAAVRYLLMSTLGSFAYLMGVVLLYNGYGTLDLSALKDLVGAGFLGAEAFALIALGLMIKAALFPLHAWLPPAHANASAPVSAILSGLVVMAAFYLLVRFWFEAFNAVITPHFGQLLGLCGAVGIFYCSMSALKQKRLKMLAAYSTAAQVGTMFLVFPLSTEHSVADIFALSGGVYFALSHALAKAAVFLCAGSIISALSHDRIEEFTGLAARMPVVMLTFAIAGLSLAGLPPSGGFIAKWQLLKAALISGQWWYAVIMVLGSLLSAAYIFRVIEVSLRKESAPSPKLPEIPRAMQYSALALSLVALLMGLSAFSPIKIGGAL